MKIAIAAFVAVGVLAVRFEAPARAENAPPPAAPVAAPASTLDSIKVWFQHWKEGLASSAVEGQYQNKSLTAVAAVRGDEQKLDDPNKPYIKGKLADVHARQLKKERAELGKAVDLILSGKAEEGSKKLDEFEANHPKSTLLPDVRKAREKLKDLKTAQAH